MSETEPNQPHIIRLRRPWNKHCDGDVGPTRIDVPEPNDSGAPHPGSQHSDFQHPSATYQRRFNRPSGLEPTSKVLLRIESWQGDFEWLSINDKPLATSTAPAEIDITKDLQDHNQIALRLAPMNNQPPQLTGAIELVIVTA